MIDKNLFDSWREKYKKNFQENEEWWDGERYKWEAVKCFKDNWDIEAEDFAEMLRESLKGTGNLLFAGAYPAGKVLDTFATEDPEAVRDMFKVLYDASRNLYGRIKYFKEQSEILQDECGQIGHHQDEHAISVYLWLRYPDKYYIYKISVLQAVSEALKSNYTFKRGRYEENINNFMAFYDEICAGLKRDKELKDMLDSKITEDCYSDSELKTLTGDFGFFVSERLKEEIPIEVNPSTMSGDEAEDNLPDDNPGYTKENFLQEVYMTGEQYDRLRGILLRKKNIILQGAPGVGKTFAAKRLAYSVMGEKDDDRIEFIQFHQNYSYEDFMMGYKPSGNGFEMKYGVFYNFCKKAEAHPDKDYFFIIDEINRGNMSKIFGELLMLIETDYRDKKITLAYDGREFAVPKRLHIIGMMNTADRSLAMIDYALRRRFSFFDMEPGFDSEGFIEYQDGLGNETFDELIEKIQELNEAISEDGSLGKGFCIGHSYFCNMEECTEEALKDIVDFDILPMLREYWFDEDSKVSTWEEKLHGVFNG